MMKAAAFFDVSESFIFLQEALEQARRSPVTGKPAPARVCRKVRLRLLQAPTGLRFSRGDLALSLTGAACQSRRRSRASLRPEIYSPPSVPSSPCVLFSAPVRAARRSSVSPPAQNAAAAVNAAAGRPISGAANAKKAKPAASTAANSISPPKNRRSARRTAASAWLRNSRPSASSSSKKLSTAAANLFTARIPAFSASCRAARPRQGRRRRRERATRRDACVSCRI